MRRTFPTVAVVATTILVLTGCGEVIGPSGPSGPPPDPSSAAMVARRERGTRAADRGLAQAVRALGGKVVGRASNDQCWEGQRNWKLDEGFDYRCAARRVAVVAFGGDFRARIARFDRRLFAAGWVCDPHGFGCESNSFLAKNYWGLRELERRPGEPFPIWMLPTNTGGYERGDVVLFVDYASALVRRSASALDSVTLISRSGLGVFHDDDRPLSIRAVVRAAKPHPYLVVITTEVDYFTSE